MNCPKCGKAMREGYLFTSKDGAFSFANTVPGVYENAKNVDGFVVFTRDPVPVFPDAEICQECGLVVFPCKMIEKKAEK